MAPRTRPAILLLAWSAACLAAPAQEGCLVKENMTYFLENGSSVTFSALTRPHQPVLEAVVTCSEEDILQDKLLLSEGNISFTRTKKFGAPESKKHPSPRASEGWTEFSFVSNSEGYRLKDSKGHTWVSEDDTEGCKPDEVTLRKGALMGECGDGAPTWQVLEGKCVEVPIVLLDACCTLQVSLYSSTPFTPSFQVGGAKFALSWANEAVLVVTGDDREPLPSNKNHSLTFVVSAEGETTLKVLVNGNIHLSVSPPSEPNVLSACGDLGHFLLQQHREVKVCEYGLPIPVQSKETLFIVAGTSLGILTLTAVSVFLYCKVARESTSPGPTVAQDNMRRSREIPPLYLEPVSVPRPKPSDPVALTYLEPRIIVHGQSLMPVRYSSSPEHTYEEVNDKGCLGDDQYLSKDQCYLKD